MKSSTTGYLISNCVNFQEKFKYILKSRINFKEREIRDILKITKKIFKKLGKFEIFWLIFLHKPFFMAISSTQKIRCEKRTHDKKEHRRIALKSSTGYLMVADRN